MYHTPRKLIEELGGYRQVASRIGIAPTTLHSHMVAGVLPPKLYQAFLVLAAEAELPAPPMRLFNFKAVEAVSGAKGRKTMGLGDAA